MAHLFFVESSWHAIETRSRIPETEMIDIGKQHELAKEPDAYRMKESRA